MTGAWQKKGSEIGDANINRVPPQQQYYPLTTMGSNNAMASTFANISHSNNLNFDGATNRQSTNPPKLRGRNRLSNIRTLAIVEAIGAGMIVFFTVLLYGFAKRYLLLEYSGIGLWAPLVIISVACLLTWMGNGISGCVTGTALGFQVLSAVSGLDLILSTTVSLIIYSHFNDCRVEKVFCILIMLGSIIVALSALATSILLCMGTCSCCASPEEHRKVVHNLEDATP